MLGLPSVGMSSGQGMGRYGQHLQEAGPGGTQNSSRPFIGSGPFWVLAFLVVGYILVFQTLRGE